MARSQFPATQRLAKGLDGLVLPVMDDGKCLDELRNLSRRSLIPLPEVLDVGDKVRGPGIEISPQFLYDMEVVLSQNTRLIFDGQELDLSEVRVGTPRTSTG